MRVFLSGSMGMVGRNIAEHLDRRKYRLLRPCRKELNLLEPRSVEEYLRGTLPDVIVHAAGLVGGIRANIQHPVEFLLVNASMGMNLIGAAKRIGIPAVLNLASSCVYPRQAKNPLQEESILTGPLEPTNEGYAIAKIATMRLCEYIRREEPRLQYKTIIPCNLYGPYDHFDAERGHMIAAVMRRMHEAKANGLAELSVWGDGTARREFMYVGDLAGFVAIYLDALDVLPDIMNIGIGHDYTVEEYYHVIAEVVGFKGSLRNDLSKPQGMKQKLLDVSLQRALGWMPSVGLIEGVERTYQYFLKVQV